jgi:hypothetical protein
LLEPGEVFIIRNRQRFRVLDVNLIEEQGLDIVVLVHVKTA